MQACRCAAALVEPMKQALTDETRETILALKEQAVLDPLLLCGSIHVYRAVLDDRVRSVEQFRNWLEHHQTGGLTAWRPGMDRLGWRG